MRISLFLVFSLLTSVSLVSLVSFAKNTVPANSAHKPVAIQPQAELKESPDEVSAQIKSCLVDLYIAQQKYFESNETYTASMSELKITEMSACQRIAVTSDLANPQTFVLLGEMNGQQWALDESKSLTQLR